MNERRRNTVAKWFVRRFPLSQTGEAAVDKLLEGIQRWSILEDEEQTKVLGYLDEQLAEDEEEWRRKKYRAKGQGRG